MFGYLHLQQISASTFFYLPPSLTSLPLSFSLPLFLTTSSLPPSCHVSLSPSHILSPSHVLFSLLRICLRTSKWSKQDGPPRDRCSQTFHLMQAGVVKKIGSLCTGGQSALMLLKSLQAITRRTGRCRLWPVDVANVIGTCMPIWKLPPKHTVHAWLVIR